MKILIFSDLHVYPHKKSNDRLTHCLDALEWVFKTALQKNIKNIVFAGDLFHDRQKIDVYTYQKTFEIFEKYLVKNNNLKIHLLLGNHDLWHFTKTNISSVNPLRANENVLVIDEPCTIKISEANEDFEISFLPYTTDPITSLNEIKNTSKYKVLFGHLAIDGAILNKLSDTHAEVSLELDGDMVKVDQSIFKNWDRVFLGHYHSPQQLNEVAEYIGSPLQLTFSETFDEKHLIVFDTKSYEKQYIINDFSPRHQIISSKDIDQCDLENNFIRVMVDDMTSTEIIELKNKFFDKSGSLEIKLKQVKHDEHLIEDAKSILNSNEEMLEQYINAIEKNIGLNELDKDKLLKIGHTICENYNE